MNHIANPRKMVSSKMEHATDATVKCPHCKKECKPDSLRWVPAAGGIVAPLTSQANRACPALNTIKERD